MIFAKRKPIYDKLVLVASAVFFRNKSCLSDLRIKRSLYCFILEKEFLRKTNFIFFSIPETREWSSLTKIWRRSSLITRTMLFWQNKSSNRTRAFFTSFPTWIFGFTILLIVQIFLNMQFPKYLWNRNYKKLWRFNVRLVKP